MLLLLAVAAYLLFDSAHGETAAEAYEEGLAAFEAEEYEAAFIHVKNALQSEPNHLGALLLSGELNLALGFAHLAELVFRKALTRGADSTLVLPLLGASYLDQSKFRELLEYIEITSEVESVEAELRTLRGMALLGLDELTEASHEFEYATRLRADFADPLLGLVSVALRKGQRDQAELALHDALNAEPSNADVWHMYAEYRRRAGDLHGALKAYDRTIEIAPDRNTARVARASVRLRLSHEEGALADLEYIREHSPFDPYANFLFSKIMHARGEITKAEEANARRMLAVRR